MNRRRFGGVALAFTAMTAVMAAKDKPMAAEKTFTGCIARSEGGAFMLTHAMAPDTMGQTMTKDSMAKDSMAKDSMAAMPPSLEVSSTRVDLSKHAGHKVTVKGSGGDMMNGKSTFTVKSLKMVAGSCS